MSSLAVKMAASMYSSLLLLMSTTSGDNGIGTDFRQNNASIISIVVTDLHRDSCEHHDKARSLFRRVIRNQNTKKPQN